MDISLGGKQVSAFKTFPEFSALTLRDKHTYEAFIKDFPPSSDTSFATLMSAWNWLDSCAVSILNGNLVISYWLPGMEQHSGLSLVGTNKVDESICTIFDHLRSQDKPTRLVLVPEFVLSHIQYPELFVCEEERNFAEYVYDVSKFYPLRRGTGFRKQRIRKFEQSVSEDRIAIRSLDLTSYDDRTMFLEKAKSWPRKGINNVAQHADDVFLLAVEHAERMAIKNICLFIDGELHGYCMYLQPSRDYMILASSRVSYEAPRVLDYMIYAFAKWFTEHGVTHANLESDLGLPFLRMFKVALGPTGYCRKYTIMPAD